MKKLWPLIFGFALLNSCEEDTDPCEGVIDDVITQTLLIELLDENGNNLIENETYIANTIATERNGFITNPVVYDETQFANLPKELKNVIVVNIFGEENQENIWSIILNEQETDILSIDLEIESTGCSGTFYNILAVEYNQEIRPVEDIGNNTYKIAIIK